tara:strand:- start:101 stop:259 length:159 start_codon:yes stop_codon:yes gene_type:complete
MTIIKLLTPIERPKIARNEVNENTPPLLDLRYLKARFNERDATNYITLEFFL